METKMNGTELLQKTGDRRSFLKGVSLIGIGIAGGALLANTTPAQSQTSAASGLSATDVAVLNFALNLEYLEAEFYTKAFYGLTLEEAGIATNGVGKSGPTTGGMKVMFEGNEGFLGFDERQEVSGRLRAVAKEITYDEQTHVKLLRSILGSQAIAKPPINLDAMGKGFANFRQFLSLARDFEDVGVSAYGGAAPLLTPTALATAARVALTEAYHASNLRLLCAENEVHSEAVDALDFPSPPVGSKYFDVDEQGLAVVRTPGQVLAIVFANATPGTIEGGFFPQGVNGSINTL
jgi:hypothetical protein